MKNIILFLAFFGVLLANAQEMDTTFVINEQGQTVGIIHEKGTVPVIPQQQYPAQQMQPQQLPPQMNPAFAFDSTVYYQSIIDNYITSGNKLRKAGNGMMIGGGIGTGVGLFMFLIGMSQIETCNDYDDNGCDDDGAVMLVAGYLGMLVGIPVFATGLTLKIFGGAKLRKADRYNGILARYQMRRQYSLKLRAAPQFNPVNNSLGGKLALDF
jgi:hypothetical protein